MEINLEKAVSYFYPVATSLELVYFEAIANAIDANATEINIEINVSSFNAPESLVITITDNGDGFTNERYKKFSKLLETEEDDHKGIGRLVFLKYFKKIEVASTYVNSTRNFIFQNTFKKKNCTVVSKSADDKQGSILIFSEFKGKKINSYDFIKPSSLIKSITYHFYPNLFSLVKAKKDLIINVSLTTLQPQLDQNFFNDTKTLIASEITNLMVREFKAEHLDLFKTFDIFYKVERTDKESTIITAICVEGRTIPIDIMPKEAIPAGYDIIFLLFSDFFKGKSNSSRQELVLNDTDFKTTKHLFRKHAMEILTEEIPFIQKENVRIKNDLYNTYPHLHGYFNQDYVGIIDKNKALDVAQKKFFLAQKEVLETQNILSEEKYEKALEISSRTLMEYILYRNVIIQNLRKLDVKSSESEIHDLIIPRRKTFRSDDWAKTLFTNNAWLLDDKYMSYTNILSDREFDEILPHIEVYENEFLKDSKRPDIAIVFSNDIKNSKKVDVVIVELKKHGLSLAKKEEVVSQLKQRARKLIKYYPDNIQRLWFYGIVDIDAEFRKSLKEEKFVELYSSGSVYYKEHEALLDDEVTRVPIGLFILSYEAFLDDAELRNNTFLEVLKTGLSKVLSEEEI